MFPVIAQKRRKRFWAHATESTHPPQSAGAIYEPTPRHPCDRSDIELEPLTCPQ
jgi:hypothetical protein